ncbi:hypothetical protein PHYSODRAFT_324705 [Phytophthora sojae]|uniref:Uncharacterized protein n=1 Tax=Phytophthora sojae (strain P6497) TaxID=1094619 RepID=G4YSK8_PHYSP|nr:hypothetical protein PHYSODRAFT_324705 [Phytophthora sojae]EGZ23501.1 hypothetical protein PHYSODRAFT_324705 [Phytophthora sojae]|eukprot:XP_009518789.1 hypothetical protein PHYSODRAFT_324705 [Phytophthora sojae]
MAAFVVMNAGANLGGSRCQFGRDRKPSQQTLCHARHLQSDDQGRERGYEVFARGPVAEKRGQEHELVRSPRAGRQCEQQEMDKVLSSGV